MNDNIPISTTVTDVDSLLRQIESDAVERHKASSELRYNDEGLICKRRNKMTHLKPKKKKRK